MFASIIEKEDIYLEELTIWEKSLRNNDGFLNVKKGGSPFEKVNLIPKLHSTNKLVNVNVKNI